MNAIFSLSQDSCVSGPREECEVESIEHAHTLALAWAKGEIGHPWDALCISIEEISYEAEIRLARKQIIVCGKAVQIDRSDIGHCWEAALEDESDMTGGDVPNDIREEIAAEIIDGGQDECSDYRATDGRHYRWE